MTAVVPPVAAAPGTPPAAAPVPPAAATQPPAVPPVTPAAPVVPEKYTLKLSDKVSLSPKFDERITPVLKDLKVADDATAQKVADLVFGEVSEVAKVYEQARAPGGSLHAAMVAGFTADSLKHPDLGNGDPVMLERVTLQAGLLLNQYGPEYAARLKATGDAVHPEFLLMMKRLYADFGEKAMARGSGSPAPLSGPTLYPGGVPRDVGGTPA